MCILSGCDYLPSIPGIGLGKASKLMRKYNLNPYRVGREEGHRLQIQSEYELLYRAEEMQNLTLLAGHL